MSDVIVGIPVKPFAEAKRRLAQVFDDHGRAVLGQTLAARTVEAVAAAGARPLVLSADEAVTRWATDLGVEVLLDEGSSLDEAALVAVSHARASGSVWAILHADLPILTGADLEPALAAVSGGRVVIAPSSDGGTSLLGAPFDEFEFAYGPGSFHRHLARVAGHDPRVIVTSGLLLDLDTPDDLRAAAGTARGAWLQREARAIGSPPS